MSNVTMSEAAKAAQNEYLKQWRKKNREKVAAINQRYWERKAAALAASENAGDTNNNGNEDQ